MGFSSLTSDSLILMILPCSGTVSAKFVGIQTHLSHRFCLTVDFPGLRRNGSSSQVINQGQDFLEQLPRHRNLGQLEGDVPAMTDDLGSNLDQLLPQRRQRPMLHLFRQSQRPHEVGKIVGQGMELKPDGVVAELAA